jgi:hypothetical protein
LQHVPQGGVIYPGLTGVSCTAANACAAVGDGPNGSLLEWWNGLRWSYHLGSEVAGNQYENFYMGGVSCASPSACIAVGRNENQNETVTFGIAYRWNGATWSTVDPARFGALSSISCSSAADCIAVGSDASSVAQWDGTSWSAQPTGLPATSSLDAISCTSATLCTALGTTNGNNGSGRQSQFAARS